MKGRRIRQITLCLLGVCSFQVVIAGTLLQEINFTLKTNPEVLVRLNQKWQAAERVQQTIAEFLPTLDGSVSWGPEDSLNFSTNQEWASLKRQEFELSAQENVFNGFKSFYGLRQRHALLHSANYQTITTGEDIALSVADSYIGILRNIRLVAIAKNNVMIHRKTFSIIGRRAHMGASAISERELAGGRYAVALTAYFNQAKDKRDAYAEYLRVVGKQAKNLSEPNGFVPYVNVSEAHAIALSLKNNPDLIRARFDVQAAVNAYKANRSLFFPKIDVLATHFRGKNIGGIEGPQYNDSLILRASWNIFRGGADVASIKESAYRQAELYSEMMRIRREVINNTKVALYALQTLRKTLPSLKAHVDKTAFVLNAYKLQYIAGKRTLLDVLNIENELFNSRRLYVNARYDYLLAKYLLLNRMGMLTKALHALTPVQFSLKMVPLGSYVSNELIYHGNGESSEIGNVNWKTPKVRGNSEMLKSINRPEIQKQDPSENIFSVNPQSTISLPESISRHRSLKLLGPAHK